MSLAISVSVVLLAATCVTATSLSSYAPLYIFRMEQASSQKSFLPSPVNSFTYALKQGCTLKCNAPECCGAGPLVFTQRSTECDETCGNSCGFTCDSCGNTCESTCPSTCGSTCPATCPSTCGSSCGGTCSTCGYTCEDTCEKTCDLPDCEPEP
jgi:hypothetical protein